MFFHKCSIVTTDTFTGYMLCIELGDKWQHMACVVPVKVSGGYPLTAVRNFFGFLHLLLLRRFFVYTYNITEN